jgi:hypothetical protein
MALTVPPLSLMTAGTMALDVGKRAAVVGRRAFAET